MNSSGGGTRVIRSAFDECLAQDPTRRPLVSPNTSGAVVVAKGTEMGSSMFDR